MNKNEITYVLLLEKQGKQWVYNRKRFKVGNSTYLPDFYLPLENLYIEVVGTRAAYDNNKTKIKEFQRLYPSIKFKIVDVKDKPIKKGTRLSNAYIVNLVFEEKRAERVKDFKDKHPKTTHNEIYLKGIESIEKDI